MKFILTFLNYPDTKIRQLAKAFVILNCQTQKKVILCNSLRRLCEKGLVKIEKTSFRHYQKRRAISLTETGKQKGLILIQEAKCEIGLTIRKKEEEDCVEL